jgi:cysteine synthase A
VFVGGAHIGGCTDTLDAYKSGQLQAALRGLGVAFDEAVDIDPHALLPGWIQKR